MSKTAAGRHLAFSETESFTIRSAVPENPRTELDSMSLSYVEPESCQFEFLNKMAAGHLGFDPTGSGAIQSVDPENPTLEP